MKTTFLTFSFLAIIGTSAFAQGAYRISLNKPYADVKVGKDSLLYSMGAIKGGLYKISVMQQGIDVVVILADPANGKVIEEKDSPNGSNGLEEFEFTPPETKGYYLIIKRLEEAGNPENGTVSINIKAYTKAELQKRSQIKNELAPENARNVLTLDIDHFWQAYDNLSLSKNHQDSVSSFQTLYLDRATDGLIDFIKMRDFTAEKYVAAVHHFPKFYNSVRTNTYSTKKAAPEIEVVFHKFNEIYPNFKPFKVCFAIGVINTGGTVSSNFVLIGSEVTTSTKETDLSEFNGSAFSKVLASGEDVIQKIRNIVAHECVHTQQKTPLDSMAIRCNLLNGIMKEGFCDFIGELVTGSQINKVAQEYGDAHEKELWQQLKNELCKQNSGGWLYNYGQVKDVPADLGYYMGYTIAREYYKNAKDKKQAVIDIIEMNNPLHFLELSGYDRKWANKK